MKVLSKVILAIESALVTSVCLLFTAISRVDLYSNYLRYKEVIGDYIFNAPHIRTTYPYQSLAILLLAFASIVGVWYSVYRWKRNE